MSVQEMRDALADLEALLDADPDHADPDVVAATEELRRALAPDVDAAMGTRQHREHSVPLENDAAVEAAAADEEEERVGASPGSLDP